MTALRNISISISIIYKSAFIINRITIIFGNFLVAALKNQKYQNLGKF